MSKSTGQQEEAAQSQGANAGVNPSPKAMRRRLLLGAAALPSVYTLTSGAGVAAASLTCWDRAPQTNPPQAVTMGPDTWYRGTMKSGKTGSGWKTAAYCMSDPAKQSQCTDPLQTDWSAASSYWNVTGTRTLEAQGGVRFIPQSPGYGLLYVDRTGTIQAFDPLQHPGIELKYASIACMTSVTLSTKSTLG